MADAFDSLRRTAETHRMDVSTGAQMLVGSRVAEAADLRDVYP